MRSSIAFCLHEFSGVCKGFADTFQALSALSARMSAKIEFYKYLILMSIFDVSASLSLPCRQSAYSGHVCLHCLHNPRRVQTCRHDDRYSMRGDYSGSIALNSFRFEAMDIGLENPSQTKIPRVREEAALMSCELPICYLLKRLKAQVSAYTVESIRWLTGSKPEMPPKEGMPTVFRRLKILKSLCNLKQMGGVPGGGAKFRFRFPCSRHLKTNFFKILRIKIVAKNETLLIEGENYV